MKTLENIDYKPLESMSSTWSLALQQTFKLPAVVTLGIALALAVVSVYYFGYFGLLFASVAFGWMSKKVMDAKDVFWRRFAESNDWYVVPRPLAGHSLIPPGLHGNRAKNRMSSVIFAEFEGRVCQVYTCSFDVGSGSKRRTHHYTVAHIGLSRVFPHLILDSKRTWALTNRGNATKRIRLEGNFDKYFSLYCEENEHIDALSIITPDVMQTLIRDNPRQDIEIVGSNMYFVMASDHRNPNAIKHLFQSVDALADDIAHKAKTIRYDETPGAANAAHIQAVLATSAKSRDGVLSSLVGTLIFVAALPIILLILVGIVMTISRGGL